MDAIQRINDDFKNRRQPFDGLTFPEEELLDECEPQNDHEKAMLLVAFSTCDYNRNARQLKDNLVELYERSSVYFAPKTFTKDYSEDELSEVMGEIGFRYRNRDASALWNNYCIIAEKYGTVRSLLIDVNYDAVNLVERLNSDGFKCLSGDKIAPMFARIVNDELVTLDRIWEVDVPVDVHIRRISKLLFDDESLSDDEIRERWREVSETHDVDRHVVDGGMWHIGNQWDEFGEEYIEEITDQKI